MIGPRILKALQYAKCSGRVCVLAAIFTFHQVATAGDAVQLDNLTHAPVLGDAPVASTVEAKTPEALPSKRANFEGKSSSRDARQVADWVVDSGDNRGMPFVIVDKTDAKVFVFDAHGQ